MHHLLSVVDGAFGVAVLAGTAAAAAREAVAQGLFGRDDETGAPTLVHEIDVDCADFFGQLLVDEIGDAIELVGCVGVFWLIQSQGQRGPASSTAREEDAYRSFPRVR